MSGVCPHCDRPTERWVGRLASRIRGRKGFWLPYIAVLSVVVAIAASVFALARSPSGDTRAPGSGGSAPQGSAPAAPAAGPAAGVVRGASTFQLLGNERDEFGHRSRLGYAFVVRSATGSTDLLTDYELVVDRFLHGVRTVDLGRGDQSFTAAIVAVSPDPHVALLRLSGTYPALRLSARPPKAGETIVFGESGSVPAPRAAVVTYRGHGASQHLAFSLSVDAQDDGTPVLDLAGDVVGIAEPSAPFGFDDLGLALPIVAACRAVRAC